MLHDIRSHRVLMKGERPSLNGGVETGSATLDKAVKLLLLSY